MKKKLIKPLLDYYQAIELDLASSTLKVMSKKCTVKDEKEFMYDKGSMDTYKKIMEILEKENIIEIGKPPK